MIRFACEHCGKKFAISDHLEGRKGVCPVCGEFFIVPSTAEAAVASRALPTRSEATDYYPAVEPPKPAESLIRFACAGCGQKIGVAPRLAGRSGVCPQCGSPFTVPEPGSAVPPPRHRGSSPTSYYPAIHEPREEEAAEPDEEHEEERQEAHDSPEEAEGVEETQEAAEEEVGEETQEEVEEGAGGEAEEEAPRARPRDQIRFACESCGQKFGVASHFAGSEGKCPKCGERFVVPEPEPVEEEESEPAEDRSSKTDYHPALKDAEEEPEEPKETEGLEEAEESSHAAPRGGLIRFYCDQCGQKFGVAARLIGKMGECPKCGEVFVVPKEDRAPRKAEEAAEARSAPTDYHPAIEGKEHETIAPPPKLPMRRPGDRTPAPEPAQAGSPRKWLIAAAVLVVAGGAAILLARSASRNTGKEAARPPQPAAVAQVPVGGSGPSSSPASPPGVTPYAPPPAPPRTETPPPRTPDPPEDPPSSSSDDPPMEQPPSPPPMQMPGEQPPASTGGQGPSAKPPDTPPANPPGSTSPSAPPADAAGALAEFNKLRELSKGSPDAFQQARALDPLEGFQDDERVIDALGKILATADELPAVRQKAAEMLGESESAKAVPYLEKGMGPAAKDPAVARAVIGSLGKIEDPTSVKALEGIIRSRLPPSADDHEYTYTSGAIIALGTLRRRDSIDVLLGVFKTLEEEAANASNANEVEQAKESHRKSLEQSIQSALCQSTGQNCASYEEWAAWWSQNRDGFE